MIRESQVVFPGVSAICLEALGILPKQGMRTSLSFKPRNIEICGASSRWQALKKIALHVGGEQFSSNFRSASIHGVSKSQTRHVIAQNLVELPT